MEEEKGIPNRQLCEDEKLDAEIEAMKITFCSQIKTAAITKAKSRNLDRSPLSIKQSHIAKRLESSSGIYNIIVMI